MKMEKSEKEEFDCKLMSVLKKITECKSFESIFTDKFLLNINNALNNGHHNSTHVQEVIQWLSVTLQSWKDNSPSVAEAVFVCQFVGVISKHEQGFNHFQSVNGFNDLCTTLQQLLFEKKSLISAYIKLLTDILNHSSGYEFIKNSEQWKLVCSLYFSNTNLYVEREGRNFLKAFINRITVNDSIKEDIFKEIFSPVSNYNETNILDNNFSSYTLLLVNLLESILKENIFNDKNFFCLKLVEMFDIQTFLKFLLENSTDESILVGASTLQILFFVANYENKEELLLPKDIPLVLDTFYTLLKQKQLNGIIKLSKYCQILWNKVEVEIKCENKCGVTFIILQLLPLFSFTKPPDTAICDLFIQKIFSLVSTGAQKLCYTVRDEVRSQYQTNLEANEIGLKAVLSVTANTESLNFEEAVIIFQSMSYALKSFIENSCEGELGELINKDRSEKQRLLLADSRLLSAVLNILCVFIQKFKINWREAIESLCLFTLSSILLKSRDLSSIVVVQALSLIKLTIVNFLSPDLALLLNNSKDPTFDYFLPILHKHMHDPNWEIRDSCLEVVTAIAELGESKYPAFQQALTEQNIYSLVVDIMEGDSESYVRASAIQALTAMTKIETINQYLFKMDFPRKVIKLLQTESEGIVRREAALLIKQIYITLNDSQSDILNSLYEIMGYLAICDLHWEVKVNSLIFWEAVIQRTMADQGMIDGSFPKVTFSKENKKIVNLTAEEVKSRLEKVLLKLSKIGCLHVLLSTLSDDCDVQVTEKSAQVLTDLKTILTNYGVIESSSVYDKTSMKRKNKIFGNCEKKKTHNLVEENRRLISDENASESFDKEPCDSDAVIDGIINERDINLLVNVSAQNEEKSFTQKKITLENIDPEAFISEIQDLNLKKLVEDKLQWLRYMETDIKSIINKNSMNFIDETNVMDCY